MKLVIALSHRVELWNVPAWFPERLRKDFPRLEVENLNSFEHLLERIQGAEIVIAQTLRPEQITAARKLRWIHCPSAAVHQLMFPELINSDIIVTNGSEVHGPVVAEHVMALIFALAKNLHRAVRFQQQKVWGQMAMWTDQPRPRELAGATLGLIGLGAIGSRVAKHAAALGMRVIAVREHPGKPKPDFITQVFGPADLDGMIAQSDYVVLTTPITPATRGLMNAARLAKMKPGACVINVGRGPLVDEPALAAALREKKIGGAALDVFEKEPLPEDSPLWELENLLITPHTGGLSEKLWERQYELMSENLRRYFAHLELVGMVDKQGGY